MGRPNGDGQPRRPRGRVKRGSGKTIRDLGHCTPIFGALFPLLKPRGHNFTVIFLSIKILSLIVACSIFCNSLISPTHLVL